jgi:UDP-3-O-[3-hydroxymyristoyl] glucosamine N-acyltransferase
MADPRFFEEPAGLSLAQVAAIAHGRLAAEGDDARIIRAIATLADAGEHDLSFLENRRYVPVFAQSRAGACLVHPRFAARAPAGMALVLCDEPYRGYALVAAALHPERPPVPGIHHGAWVDLAARLGEGVAISAGAVIEAGVEIGAGSVIGANSVIGAGVQIGVHGRIGANVTISHAVIGARVRIFPGVRIGQDGFGYALGTGGPLKVPQLGRVLIGDGVEIGANSTIDRGSLGDTIIGDGTVIDNLVQVGHNVRIGRGCVLVGQVGISGSAQLADFVVVGGQAGIGGHLQIGARAQIAAKSGVHRDVPAGGAVGGAPAVPMREFRRIAGAMRRLGRAASAGSEPVEE